MILQALTKLYYDLSQRGEISKPGWGNTKVGYSISLTEQGDIISFTPEISEISKDGKTIIVNKTINLPAAVKRTVGIAPNFLWDNSCYVLGIDDKGKPQRSEECFESFKLFHHKLLDNVDSAFARGILNFLDKWVPSIADQNEAFLSVKEEIIKGVNIVFRVNGSYVHEDPVIASIWQNYYDKQEGEPIQCLISGEKDILESVHPAIKGVKDAQSSGAALISFNAPAFCSYGHEQGSNAPVGKKAAFAYTTALNYLLSDRENVQIIGDTTVVSWAEGGEKQYTGFSVAALFGNKSLNDIADDDLHAIVKRLAEGLPCAEYKLDPSKRYYILGLSPNAARLSVRFFYQSDFGSLMKNINDHHERLSINGTKYQYMPLWALLRETVNLNLSDKSPSPVLSGSVARAIFQGDRYPAGLIEAVMLRIRAERNITPGRAAIIKGYYLRNNNIDFPQEVLTVGLNENSTNVPYTIGRLFAIYEAVQERANPGINATIRDKYFNSAASSPAHIMPVLNSLYQKHLRKLEKGVQVYYEKQVAELLELISENYPTRMSLPEQGAYQLGYYHQKQKRYEKKGNE